MTIAQLTQKTNAACADQRAKENALARPADFNTNPKSAAAYLRKLASVQQAALPTLRMNPPASLRAAFIQYFGGTLHGALLYILASNNAQTGGHTYPQLLQQAATFRQQNLVPLAHKLGLGSCPP